jgi:hypothetical protein
MNVIPISEDVVPQAGERRYLPTLADLIDRLSIVLLKSVFISDNHDAYLQEAADIEHDIGLIIDNPSLIRAVLVVMLANRVIWENEAKARLGGDEQDKLLKFTHSVNGIRNHAKNVISAVAGERKDLKIDCLAANLPPEFGAWEGLL